MKYICKTKCYFRKRLWAVGEVIVPQEGEELPRHFVKKGEAQIAAGKLAGAPKTMKELHESDENMPPLSKPSGPVAGVEPAPTEDFLE